MKSKVRINIFSMYVVLSVFFSACSNNISWTPEDKASAIHYYNSQRANKAATKILNQGTPYGQISEDDLSMMCEYMRTALSEAKMVSDAFFDKVHPDFRKHYRYEYQKSLELRIKNLEKPNIPAEMEGQLLYNA